MTRNINSLSSILLVMTSIANICAGKATNEISVYVPPLDGGALNTRNFAVVLMMLAFLYVLIMLYQVCRHKDGGSEYEDYYSNSYYYTEDYTNSKYAQSDGENSLVDHRFGYNQSLNQDDTSRRESSPLNKVKLAEKV